MLFRSGELLAPDGQRWEVVDARVLSWVASVRARPAIGGYSRTRLFHRLNTPADDFRRLKARLRWPVDRVGPDRGNFALEEGSHSLTHGASGGVNGGTGLANPHDR